MGKAAVEFAVAGKNAVMPTIVRKPGKTYRWSVGEAKLEDVANIEQKLPDDYITSDGFGITDACRNYLEPLIQGEDYPPYKKGLPKIARLKKIMVEKKLKAKFMIKS